MNTAVLRTNLEGMACMRGKVRDVYDLGDRLVLVATDRISAFDWVLPNGIPDKGRILTAMSLFWFRRLAVANHFLSVDLDDMGPAFADHRDIFSGRSMLVRKTKVIPIECVVRGYLVGSGWNEYREQGTVCDQRLPSGLIEAERLPEPIFTPALKASEGHDENISIERMAQQVGDDLTGELQRRSMDIYRRAAEHAASVGIILADTKFEFGIDFQEQVLLIDEALTPDSSRFWPADAYQPGRSQPSFDKQYVRDWLESVHFDKKSPPPPLPDEVIAKTREKYFEAFRRLTGTAFEE